MELQDYLNKAPAGVLDIQGLLEKDHFQERSRLFQETSCLFSSSVLHLGNYLNVSWLAQHHFFVYPEAAHRLFRNGHVIQQ